MFLCLKHKLIMCCCIKLTPQVLGIRKLWLNFTTDVIVKFGIFQQITFCCKLKYTLNEFNVLSTDM